MAIMGLLIGAFVCWLWYAIPIGKWLALIAFSAFLIPALTMRVSAQSRLKALGSEIENKLTPDAYEYLLKYAQFFLYPGVANIQAGIASSLVVPLIGLGIALLIAGRWLELILVVVVLVLMLRIAGTWNHPFHAARRAHLRETNFGQLSLEEMNRVAEERAFRKGEMYEKELYDEIVSVLNSKPKTP